MCEPNAWTYRHLDPNTGDLILRRWATPPVLINGDWAGSQLLTVDLGPGSVEMAHSTATGDPLVSNGSLGVDRIRLGAGEGFEPHTHPGDHLLIVIGGRGTITYGGKVYPTEAGQIYMVEGSVPHAVGAISDHVILAVGSPHVAVGAPERMEPVEYRSVTVPGFGLHCLICGIHSDPAGYLHDSGCPHCPCKACVSEVGRGVTNGDLRG